MSVLRILLCSPTCLNERLGAAKVYIGIKKQYESFGHKVSIISPDIFDAGAGSKKYFSTLMAHIINRGNEYDVVEYEHNILPYERAAFPQHLKMIARIVLLTHFSLNISFYKCSPLGKFFNILSFIKNYNRRQNKIYCANKTLKNADLVLCSNDAELTYLNNKLRLPINKLFLNPFGLAIFEKKPIEKRKKTTILFLGTLDPRKGLFELPFIFKTIHANFPDLDFLLAGTGFFIKDLKEQEILFKDIPHNKLCIIQEFDPEMLKVLVSNVLVGVFPSQVEGCPFSIMEQMNFGIPVFGYRAPGVSMLLPEECLVDTGNVSALCDKLLDYLKDSEKLGCLGEAVYEKSLNFDWSVNAQKAIAKIAAL